MLHFVMVLDMSHSTSAVEQLKLDLKK